MRRRPVDLARHGEAIAAAQGWVVVGRHPSEAQGDADAEVSLVVSGGGLRGRAMLTVGRAGPRRGRPPDGVAPVGVVLDGVVPDGVVPDGVTSSHLPRSLPPPDDRRARCGEVAVRLREHPGRGTLDDLLAGSGALTAGEAVTVLTAAARGIRDVHGVGGGGVRLEAADIGFRDDGCPVLTGVDRLRDLDQRTMAQDVAAFATLAGMVSGSVDGEPGAAVLAAATDRSHGSWADVVDGLLRAADPTAVRPAVRRGPVEAAFGPSRADSTGAEPTRTGATGARVMGAAHRGDRPIARWSAAALAWIAARPKVVAIACSPLVAVGVLLMIVPGGEGSS